MWMSERKEKRNRYKVIFFFSRNSIVLSLNDNLHFIIRRFPSYFFLMIMFIYGILLAKENSAKKKRNNGFN